MKKSRVSTQAVTLEQAPESLVEKILYGVMTIFLLLLPALIWFESLIEGQG